MLRKPTGSKKEMQLRCVALCRLSRGAALQQVNHKCTGCKASRILTSLRSLSMATSSCWTCLRALFSLHSRSRAKASRAFASAACWTIFACTNKQERNVKWQVYPAGAWGKSMGMERLMSTSLWHLVFKMLQKEPTKQQA